MIRNNHETEIQVLSFFLFSAQLCFYRRRTFVFCCRCFLSLDWSWQPIVHWHRGNHRIQLFKTPNSTKITQGYAKDMRCSGFPKYTLMQQNWGITTHPVKPLVYVYKLYLAPINAECFLRQCKLYSRILIYGNEHPIEKLSSWSADFTKVYNYLLCCVSGAIMLSANPTNSYVILRSHFILHVF